ncbi:diguanylate cyclase [Halopseudomonas sp.]|uniref:GGDEF domain-containing protein n=1 Tax=Halopseudomonas sp. TaxID=2901191 RepID=UPI003561C297
MSTFGEILRQRLVTLLPGELKPREIIALLVPNRHSVLLTQRRSTMIVNRVRLFAFLFAVLTPLWSVIDLMVFPLPLWLGLAACRILVCAAFIWLLLMYQPRGSLLDAYRAVAILFAIPTAFYIVSHTILGHYQLSSLSAAVGAGYAFLPFVLMAGLAIFPLALLENAVMVVILLLAQACAGALSWTVLNWPSFAGALWLLMLIGAVSSLAGMSQLAFMIALVRQAIRDPLTGVFSRGSGEEILKLQWENAQRQNSTLAIAFIDLDHFKSLNDTYGHEAGDRALIEASRILQSALRGSDTLVRWGGEEFLLLMPGTSLSQAATALERVLQTGLGVRPDGSALTASIGLGERRQDAAANYRSLLEQADQRMYRAKAAGRNQLCSGADTRPDPVAA